MGLRRCIVHRARAPSYFHLPAAPSPSACALYSPISCCSCGYCEHSPWSNGGLSSSSSQAAGSFVLHNFVVRADEPAVEFTAIDALPDVTASCGCIFIFVFFWETLDCDYLVVFVIFVVDTVGSNPDAAKLVSVSVTCSTSSIS